MFILGQGKPLFTSRNLDGDKTEIILQSIHGGELS